MALRQAMKRMAPLVGATSSRAFGTSAMRANEAQEASRKAFLSRFEQVKPSTMDNPSTPVDFLKPGKEAPTSIPSKLTLNFYMPHEIEFNGAEVDSVLIPATTGDFGVLPGHVPTVAQIRPGVVTVNLSDKEAKKVRGTDKTRRSATQLSLVRTDPRVMTIRTGRRSAR